MNISQYKDFVGKGYTEAFLSNKYVFRHISVYISFLCVNVGISANSITTLSLIFALVGGYLQVYSDFWALLISSVLLFLYYVLDMVDGEIARFNLKFKDISSGKAGAFYDVLIHYLLSPILFFAIGLNSYYQYNETMYLWAGLWSGMWISGYVQSSANRVIFDYVLIKQNDDATIQKIWKYNKINMLTASTKQKLRFAIKEAFSSQGQIFAVIICFILDLFLKTDYSFRTIYLVLFSVIGIFNFPKSTFLFFKRLKELK